MTEGEQIVLDILNLGAIESCYFALTGGSEL